MSEKEVGESCPTQDVESAREERLFRHRIGYMAMLTVCTVTLCVVFIGGWSVIVQEKEIAESVIGTLFRSLGEVLKVILS